MLSRGVRGATTVEANDKQKIIEATKELLLKIVEENGIMAEEISAALFSSTEELNAEFPAVAAREIGWSDVPLLCMREINVSGSLPNCIRVLLQINTDKTQKEIKHVYLRGAVNLRR